MRFRLNDERSRNGAPPPRVPPLVAQIAEELSQDIVLGRYTPGERIREQELAKRFGTSRAPVREAIRLLEIEGLIRTEHWRGARVVDMSVDETDDLFEILSAIFGLVARLAARHGSQADAKAFDDAVEAMGALHASGAPGDERVRASFDAARILREACSSQMAGEMLRKLARIAFLQHKVVQAADQVWQARALRDWRALAVAVADQDGSRSEQIARRLVHQTQEFTLRHLRSDEAANTNGPKPARKRASGKDATA